jgi:tetratricopeptide (TPR) repeat protein
MNGGGRVLKQFARLIGSFIISALCSAMAAPPSTADLVYARDIQSLQRLEYFIRELQPAATSAPGEYRLAVAYSYAAEVAFELHDKKKSEELAEAGLDVARKAEAEDGKKAEYHLIMGQLCGQVIPANPLMGTLKYGQCARDEINAAIQLNPQLALAYVTRGVGNYYLPAQMGGGPDIAVKDFEKAIAMDPKLSEAYLWKGITLRKMHKNAEAYQALQRALQLDPNRAWTKEQLAKTPQQ